ncbi:head completion/stabilization protein [Variovorax sp.]|jgi:hypothetical protein|uniref:head completion/stabilization protein n=1 Tax=Variovorax sp. TaxID=1871043 RepID=UPI0037DA2FA5
MSFVALPPTPASPAASVVPGDGWYPDIDCNDFRNALRMGEMVTHDRLVGAIEGAQVTVERELAAWRAACEMWGAATLAEVEPNRLSGGKHRLTLIYTRAVRMHAAAELAETHRDLTATQDGQARADTDETTAREYLRRATHAVRDILGVTRTAVELI